MLLITGKAQEEQNAIVGKWMYEKKNLVVDVYKENDDFKARIVWFHDTKDTLTPIEDWRDIKNPDKHLRSRPILGMDVLSGLEYDADEHRWVNGRIYDSSSGKTWDATVKLSNDETMEVRGYYIFRFIGKTMKFTRI